jgi:hypothetical protein
VTAYEDGTEPELAFETHSKAQEAELLEGEYFINGTGLHRKGLGTANLPSEEITIERRDDLAQIARDHFPIGTWSTTEARAKFLNGNRRIYSRTVVLKIKEMDRYEEVLLNPRS